MRRFFILLKKEIRELLTPQMVIPFVLIIVVLYVFGQYATKEAKKSQGPQPIAVVDQDNSTLSKSLVDVLSKSNFDVKAYPSDSTNIPTILKNNKLMIGLVIPNGFEKSVTDFAPKKLDTYAYIANFSVVGISKYANADKAVGVINEVISQQYLAAKAPNTNPSLLKNPVTATAHTAVKDKIAETSATAVLTYLATQASFVPVILFLVITLASQMIATSIASEKENKTLETLLTAPLNRKMVVTAKMIGAGLVGLLLSSVYLIGFRSFITGGNSTFSSGSVDVGAALRQLDLVLTPSSYLLMGVVVFLGILVALSISIILGAFAEDVKGVQGTIAPLMVLMLIPYFATLLLDIGSLPTLVRYFIYAIPFSHIFLAMPNLYLHNNLFVIYGAIYELILFAIFTIIAARIFSSDLIFTMRLNFSKKKRNV